MKLPVRDNIASLIPYPPGKPLEELEREYGITGSIKLASNENAMGPSPKAVAAALIILLVMENPSISPLARADWKASGSMNTWTTSFCSNPCFIMNRSRKS